MLAKASRQNPTGRMWWFLSNCTDMALYTYGTFFLCNSNVTYSLTENLKHTKICKTELSNHFQSFVERNRDILFPF